MAERLDPILPQVPVEGIAVHIAKSGIGMGDTAQAVLMPDGRVGVYALVKKRWLGLFSTRKLGYLGHMGPIPEQVLAPALAEGVSMRLRIVVLTPEHLATNGPPEIYVSVWADQSQMAPFLAVPEFLLNGLSVAPSPQAVPEAAPAVAGLTPLTSA